MSVDIEAILRKTSSKTWVVAAPGLKQYADNWHSDEHRSRHAFVNRQTDCFASSAREASVAMYKHVIHGCIAITLSWL